MAGNWTKTPNEILDAMPDMGEAELKLTAVLIRETYGRHQMEIKLTWDDMMSMASIGSRQTVQAAIEAVDNRGFFKRGRRSLWSVNSTPTVLSEMDYSTESVLSDNENSTPTVPENSTVSVPSSYNIKKEEKESEPTPSPIKTLAAAFVEKTGIFASLAAWASDWELPLTTILQHSDGDLDTAVSKIEAAVDLARQKGYTIKSPMSLTTIVANMNGTNGSHSGVLKVNSR